MFGRGRGREGEEVLTLAEPAEDQRIYAPSFADLALFSPPAFVLAPQGDRTIYHLSV